MSTDDIPEIHGVDPTPIDQPIDDEAIASAVNEAEAGGADASLDVSMVDDDESHLDHHHHHETLHQEKDEHDPDNTFPPPPPDDEQGETHDQLELSDPLHEQSPKANKEARKRIRRVGKVVARKLSKLNEHSMHPNIPILVENPTSAEAAADGSSAEAAAAVAQAAQALPDVIPRVISKHDEKWNAMFEKLIVFKNQHNTCLVPQCYGEDPRLGRWAHYQRVEYWLMNSTGAGKITPERIARLEAIGFEWDPQRAQWNHLFEKLLAYKEEHGHCKVPKGYTQDPELANWVRNQRLEHANLIKGKKSRMTDDRFKKLDELGFRWSTAMPAKGGRKKDAKKETETKSVETDEAKDAAVEANAPAKLHTEEDPQRKNEITTTNEQTEVSDEQIAEAIMQSNPDESQAEVAEGRIEQVGSIESVHPGSLGESVRHVMM